ncbi:MAG TPA: hypothetical protein VLJ59_09885 [Mycobacteriales bacterium]|nr:hypothetical protein [Mycobacteriales bacterium]
MTDTRSGPFASSAGHPDLDMLADFDAGVLDPADSARVGAHTVACARCQAAVAGLADVLGLLRRQPTPPMPAAVEERIFAALAAERQSRFGPATAAAPPVTSLDRARRRRRAGLVGLVAAGVVLLAGTTVAGILNTTRHSGQGALAGSRNATPSSESGTLQAFTRDTIATAPVLSGILNGQGGPLLPQGTQATSDRQGPGAEAVPVPGSLAGPMADPRQRQSCESGIGRAVPGRAGPAAAVQYLRFEGRPAFLFVYLRDGHRHLVVVGAGCASGNAEVLFTETL